MVNLMMILTLICVILLLNTGVNAFVGYNAIRPSMRPQLQMGFGDFLKNALANDPSMPPPSNPGLSKSKTAVEVEFLPSKKVVKALPGQRLSVVAQSAGVDIKYKCNKGECGTCTVRVNGVPAKVCQTAIPTFGTETKFTIVVPSK